MQVQELLSLEWVDNAKESCLHQVLARVAAAKVLAGTADSRCARITHCIKFQRHGGIGVAAANKSWPSSL